MSGVVSLGVLGLVALQVTAHGIPGSVAYITGAVAYVFPGVTSVLPVIFSVESAISVFN